MTTDEIQAALAEYFDPKKVSFKPITSKGDKALVAAYVDARDVMDRLDEVVGVGNWQDSYDILDAGNVLCHLSIKIDGEWITKTDVGGPSEQPDHGDRMKAAVSDSMKRAAVKWGIARYLHQLPMQWCDYDPQRKRLLKVPALPAPRPKNTPKSAARPAPAREEPMPTSAAAAEPQKGFINENQGMMLQAKMMEHGAAWPKLAAHYRISRLGELPAQHLDDALKNIEAGRFAKASAGNRIRPEVQNQIIVACEQLQLSDEEFVAELQGMGVNDIGDLNEVQAEQFLARLQAALEKRGVA